jgi:NADPH-dependent curcumin reductase
MPKLKNRQVVLARRPVGAVSEDDFRFVETEFTPSLEEGQILVRNLYLSLDPAIRGWMTEGASYIEPIAIGGAIRSGSLSELIESRHPDFKPGQKVSGLTAWEDYSVVSGSRWGQVVPEGLGLPLSNFLGVLGGNGLTAYFGLFDVGEPKEGETVVVSAAAGGVGSIVGQLAKNAGCRVVGICGSNEKCAWLVDELGFDAAINYKTADLAAALKTACPKGIHVVFDSVGGDVLDACLLRIAKGARVVICGAMSQLNQSGELPPGPSNYIRLLTKRAKMQGFVTLDYAARYREASGELAKLLLAGKLKVREEMVSGLENAPAAFLRLFTGGNTGKLIVKL